MNQSMHSDDLSFCSEAEPLQLQTHAENPARHIFSQINKSMGRTNNQAINVLSPNKTSAKMEVSQEFQDYLTADAQNSQLIIVSFMGSKKVGKSFLIDCLISNEQAKISRFLSKTSKPYINAPTFQTRARNNEKILYFDIDGQPTTDVFLWSYFLSSTIVLNLNGVDRQGEQAFLKNCSYLRSRLEGQAEDMSLPSLIIVRRDVEGGAGSIKQPNQKEFAKKIEDYGLFSGQIELVSLPFPGNSSVKTKEVIDVPATALDPSFISGVTNLQMMLKHCHPKTLSGNYLTSKICAVSLQPLTRIVNKEHRLNTQKIWGDVMQTLSVGYYNYYIKKYSQQLQKQFADERPCDKYTLYKKLSGVRRRIESKVQGFNNVANDPTFQKYQQKLEQKINAKQQMIRNINKQKSRQANSQLCKRLFSQINESNSEKLIEEYCKSPLDDDKSEVLLQHFEALIKARSSQLQKSKNPTKKHSVQIIALEEELKKIEDQLNAERKVSSGPAPEYDTAKVQLSIEEKQRQIKDLEKQLQRQKAVNAANKSNQSKEILEMEANIENLKSKARSQQKQIDVLRTNKQQQVKDAVNHYTKQLKEEQEKHARLQQQVKKLQAQNSQVAGKGNAKPGSKDTCCSIM